MIILHKHKVPYLTSLSKSDMGRERTNSRGTTHVQTDSCIAPSALNLLLFAAAAATAYRIRVSKLSPMRFTEDSHAEIHSAAHTPVSQPVNGFSVCVRESACY